MQKVGSLGLRAGLQLQLVAHLAKKFRDDGFIAFEEVPLADLAAGDQAGALQYRQVCRDGGLGQPAALIELAGADADLPSGTTVLRIANALNAEFNSVEF